MTALPVTEDQIESFKKDLELRKKAYLILKSGDLNSLNDEACHIVGVPPFSYKDVLDLWKTELENCSDEKEFLRSLGVEYHLNPNFSLLGLDMEKLPYPYDHPEIIKSPQMDLDKIWDEEGNAPKFGKFVKLDELLDIDRLLEKVPKEKLKDKIIFARNGKTNEIETELDITESEGKIADSAEIHTTSATDVIDRLKKVGTTSKSPEDPRSQEDQNTILIDGPGSLTQEEAQKSQEEALVIPAEEEKQPESKKKLKTAEEKALERHLYVESTPGIIDDILEQGSNKFSDRGSKKRGNVAGVVRNNRKKSGQDYT